MKGLDGHAFLTETLHIVWNKGFQLFHPLSGLATAVTIVKEQVLKLVLRHSQDLFQGKATLLKLADILAHRVTGDMKSTGNAFYSHSHNITSE